MWILILAALRKYWGVIALAALLSVGLMWYGNKREAAGFQKGSVSQLAQDKTQFQQVLEQYSTALSKAQSQIAQDDLRLQDLSGKLASISSVLTTLANQRQTAQTTVNQIPDSAITADLETKLGGPLTDTTTIRKADSIVTDYPLVLKSVDALNAKVDNLTQSVSVLQDVVKQTSSQRDAAIAYGNTVTGFYVKAYNAAQKHHSTFVKIITLGLVHDSHLSLPAPETLNVPTVSTYSPKG